MAAAALITNKVVSTEIDVFVYIDVFIHVFHDDLLPRVVHVRSPMGDAIIIVSTVERAVIRHVISRTVTDADIVGAPAKT